MARPDRVAGLDNDALPPRLVRLVVLLVAVVKVAFVVVLVRVYNVEGTNSLRSAT